MAKIILINPCSRDNVGTTSVALTIPPLGLAYLGAQLRRGGHQVQIIDSNVRGLTQEQIIHNFQFDPDFVGFSANVLTYKTAIKNIKRIKEEYPYALSVLGGPHASTLPEYILERNNFVDIIVIGEGEETFLEIADSCDLKTDLEKIKGIAFRKQKDVIVTESRPLISNLDELPMPAYDLLPPFREYKTRSRSKPVGYILTSRGCPSQCSYCYRSFGNNWREFSPERVVDEIVHLKEKYQVRQIDVMDDNFTFNVERASRILDLIIEKDLQIDLNLQIGIRVDRVNEALLKKMKKAGVFKLGFGVESGDEDILKQIKKGISLRKAETLVDLARKLGIITHGYFMVGFPFDTRASIVRTIDFAVKLNPHYASFSLYTPLPGTELFEMLEGRNQITEDVREGIDHGLFSSRLVFKGDHLSEEEVVHYFHLAWSRFYSRPSKVLDVLQSIRSKGELSWMMRTIFEIIRTRNGKKI